MTPPMTASTFKDAKAFEEYKHLQFVMEHRRLQLAQEQQESAEKKKRQKHGRRGDDTDVSQDQVLVVSSLDGGSIAVTTAQVASQKP
ncbi:hypothetical protein BGX28_008958 [Mortierella sp. GBA30]|nr:hypothetical protein BGX28_008958 [Mortierella sp. GBA30]